MIINKDLSIKPAPKFNSEGWAAGCDFASNDLYRVKILRDLCRGYLYFLLIVFFIFLIYLISTNDQVACKSLFKLMHYLIFLLLNFCYLILICIVIMYEKQEYDNS